MMKIVKVTVTGLSPLIMNRFPLEPVEALKNKPPQEQAEIAAYREPATQELYVPGLNLQRCLIAGAAYSKGKGRGSLQKEAAACLLVAPEYVLLGTKNFVVDSRAVVVPATKGRVVRHRPRINDWKLTFTLEFDDALISEKQLRRIVDDAGVRVGLLDFRPERRGPFGRFRVDDWK
jgi:hypothetical protein